jgi:hypothetical protein
MTTPALTSLRHASTTKKDYLWPRSALQLHAAMLRKVVRGLQNLYIYAIINREVIKSDFATIEII